jgi:hypothetical protein
VRRTALDMQNLTWGWTIEMQVTAIETGLRVAEITVRSIFRLFVTKRRRQPRRSRLVG